MLPIFAKPSPTGTGVEDERTTYPHHHRIFCAAPLDSDRRPDRISRLETSLGETQSEVIHDFIENSCWSADLPDFTGGRGTPANRRAALRAAYLAQNPNG